MVSHLSKKILYGSYVILVVGIFAYVLLCIVVNILLSSLVFIDLSTTKIRLMVFRIVCNGSFYRLILDGYHSGAASFLRALIQCFAILYNFALQLWVILFCNKQIHQKMIDAVKIIA